ncbi:2OG-Fe(II) oxygenase [Chitinolyticbacter albus]|uniref:2OG-Fe(II) oxygenase n=1 Tax=Chitinolyticbacter albus TaxID=2961951 RepID=UPI00210AE27F|nr:2OG-Fe(II) oxygenase [Chitinolyticbacter albus]
MSTFSSSALPKTTRYGAGVFTIHDVLSAQECTDQIARSEQGGYDAAPLQTAQGPVMASEVRNNDRLIVDDTPLAASLFERVQVALPPELEGWRVSRLNERFRYYRYTPEQYFKWHYDGTYRASDNEESFLTLLIYLNANYTGGATEFGWDAVQPATGMALVFPHQLRHQGATIIEGTKYVLRTDVMYQR